MKVLIAHHQMKLYGGAEQVIVHLANYLQGHGHTVRILAANTTSHSEYTNLDIVTSPKEIEWHLWDGGFSSLYELSRVWIALSAMLKKHARGFDIINIHNFPAIWAAPRDKQIVWLCNEVPDLWHRQHTSLWLNQILNIGRFADRQIARSKHPYAVVADRRCRDIFHKRYGLEPTIIHYGIEGEFFAQGKGTPPDNKFRIMCPSMISPSKNQLGILQAVSTLDFSTEVVLCGYREPTHPYSQLLEEYITRHNLKVKYIPPTSRENLRNLYPTAHVAVFLGKGQGSWLGAFEQLAAGTPVIVSPNLTCSDLILEHNIGTVTDNIADALQEIHSNYEKYQQQALRGKAFVLKHLTWEKFGQKMEAILETACK